MSFLSDASLVMIPSGYKDQKVYSSTPTDGSADLTFSRASSATRVNSSGLVEKVRENLNLYSQDFTNAAYVTAGYGSRASVVADTTANPLTGAQDADTATFSAGVAQSRLLQQFTGLSTTNKFTYSLYVKAGTKSTVKIYGEVTAVGVFADFDLATASVIGTPTLCTASIVSAGSGWYRCSITFNAQGAGSVDCGPVSWAGEDGTLFIYGAQLEVSDFGPTPYIATTSSAVSVGPVSGLPRLDYSGGATCPSLLLEPQRTNVLPQSNYFAAADWIKINGSIATNQATSPEGIGNASTFTEDTSSGFHVMYDNIVAAFSTAHTLSAFVKPNGRNIMYLRMENASTGSGLGITYFNISTGQILTDSSTSSSIEAYANGWYRVSITATTPSAQSTLFAIGLADVDNSRSYTGDGTSGIYLYGAQAEPSATYPTSLIPTNGTSVTRVGDIALKTSISSLIGQTEGTLFFDWIMNHESPNSSEDLYTLTMSDGTGNKIIGINNYNQTLAVFIKDTTTQFFDNSYTSGTDGARIKLALAYANNDVALYINGTQIATDSSATIPTLSQVRLNTFWNGNYPDSTSVNQLLLFKTLLTNAELAALTA